MRLWNQERARVIYDRRITRRQLSADESQRLRAKPFTPAPTSRSLTETEGATKIRPYPGRQTSSRVRAQREQTSRSEQVRRPTTADPASRLREVGLHHSI